MLRQADKRIGETFIIHVSNVGTVAIILVEALQLDSQHCRLQFIDATIVTRILEHILLLRAIVSQGAYHPRQFIIVRGYTPRIAQCPEVLSRVEAVSGSMAQRACSLFSVVTPVRLCVILNQQQVVPFAQLTDTFCIGTTAIEMHNHDSPSMRSDGLPDLRIINLQGISIWLYKYRLQPIIRDGQDTGNIGIGRHNHLIPLVQQPHLQIGA